MTILFSVLTTEDRGNCQELGILEITPHGIRNTDNPIRLGQRRDFLQVHETQAILLAAGIFDYSDGVAKEDEHRVYNPLDAYLKREHPTMTLQDELRAKLKEAEDQRDHWKKKYEEVSFKLNRITSALGE